MKLITLENWRLFPKFKYKFFIWNSNQWEKERTYVQDNPWSSLLKTIIPAFFSFLLVSFPCLLLKMKYLSQMSSVMFNGLTTKIKKIYYLAQKNRHSVYFWFFCTLSKSKDFSFLLFKFRNTRWELVHSRQMDHIDNIHCRKKFPIFHYDL